MSVILITSDRPGVGKTAMAAALAMEAQASGKTAAYIKSISENPLSDPDVAYFKEQALPDWVEVTEPQLLGEDQTLSVGQSESITAAVEKASSEAQFVLVEAPTLVGPRTNQTSFLINLAQASDAKILVLWGFQTGVNAEAVQEACGPLREHLAGVVVNNVPKFRQRQLLQDMASGLDAHKIKLLGSIPADRIMASVTVGQIAKHISAQWIAGENGTGILANHVLIGGNIMDSSENYFGRHDGQVVLVRGDRPDIQLACLNTNTVCLVLTGGFTPNQYVFLEAERRDVPLLVVEGSTAATAETLDEILATPLVHHPAKIKRFRDIIRDNLDREFLSEMLEGIAKSD